MKLLFSILAWIIITKSAFAGEPFSFGGFGNGIHNHHMPDSPNGHIITILKKNNVTYKYIWLNDKTAVLSKDGGKSDIEIGADFGINHIALTYLADVLESESKITLLLVTAQAYHYIELVKNYPSMDPPPGDAYLNFHNKFEKHNWKPYKYVSFVPKGMHATNFFDEIKVIKSIRIAAPGKIEIVNSENNHNIYSVSEESIELNGGVHKTLDYKYKQKLESEFIAQINNLSDDSLLQYSQHFVDNNGKELKSSISDVLDSMKNREMAEKIKSRILELHAKQ